MATRLKCTVNADYHRFLERHEGVRGAVWVVKGTRVPVRTLLDSLAEGATVEDILGDFPTVSADALRAVLAFAAASVKEE